MEIWKLVMITGFEGLYEVSNMGLVRNKATGRVLTPEPKGGYLRVRLRNNGHRKCFLIHRLVAIAFIPNPENKKTVNHKAGIKNDRVSELEWATHKENTQHAINVLGKRIGLLPGTRPNNTLILNGWLDGDHPRSKKIIAYNPDGSIFKIFNSTSGAAREMGTRHQYIYRCLKNYPKTHKGLKWEYWSTQTHTCIQL